MCKTTFIFYPNCAQSHTNLLSNNTKTKYLISAEIFHIVYTTTTTEFTCKHLTKEVSLSNFCGFRAGILLDNFQGQILPQKFYLPRPYEGNLFVKQMIYEHSSGIRI